MGLMTSLFYKMENKKCLKPPTSFNLSNWPDQYLTYAFNLPKACHDKHCLRNIGQHRSSSGNPDRAWASLTIIQESSIFQEVIGQFLGVLSMLNICAFSSPSPNLVPSPMKYPLRDGPQGLSVELLDFLANFFPSWIRPKLVKRHPGRVNISTNWSRENDRKMTLQEDENA